MKRFGPWKEEHDALAAVPQHQRSVAAVARLRDGASRALHALIEHHRRARTDGLVPDPAHLAAAERELLWALAGLEGP